jgi:hypothetical protein
MQEKGGKSEVFDSQEKGVLSYVNLLFFVPDLYLRVLECDTSLKFLASELRALLN